jgi:hypothetical protein
MNCFSYDLSPDFSYLLLPPYGKVPCASLASKSSWETVTQEFGWTRFMESLPDRQPGLDDARRCIARKNSASSLRRFVPTKTPLLDGLDHQLTLQQSTPTHPPFFPRK